MLRGGGCNYKGRTTDGTAAPQENDTDCTMRVAGFPRARERRWEG